MSVGLGWDSTPHSHLGTRATLSSTHGFKVAMALSNQLIKKEKR